MSHAAPRVDPRSSHMLVRGAAGKRPRTRGLRRPPPEPARGKDTLDAIDALVTTSRGAGAISPRAIARRCAQPPLHVMRTPAVRLLALRVLLAARNVQRLTPDVVIRNRGRELRQVLRALVRHSLEPRSEGNQLWLAESRAEERKPHRNAEHVRRRHLHV